MRESEDMKKYELIKIVSEIGGWSDGSYGSTYNPSGTQYITVEIKYCFSQRIETPFGHDAFFSPVLSLKFRLTKDSDNEKEIDAHLKEPITVNPFKFIAENPNHKHYKTEMGIGYPSMLTSSYTYARQEEMTELEEVIKAWHDRKVKDASDAERTLELINEAIKTSPKT